MSAGPPENMGEPAPAKLSGEENSQKIVEDSGGACISNERHAAAIALVAWAVPGLGHVLLRKRARAAVFFAAVAALALWGYAMRGAVFSPGANGPLGKLGFLADLGCGVFYFLARVFEPGGADLAHAAGDYGTRIIAAAGITNLLAVIDAYETAARRRA